MSTTGKKGLQSLILGGKIIETRAETEKISVNPPEITVETPEMSTDPSPKPWKTIPLTQIHPNPNQPRKEFAGEELQELSEEH